MRTRVSIALVAAVAVAAALWLPVQPVYASSDSMAPAIEVGDLYFVHTGESVATGDVVTFESPARSGLVTHRVVGETAAGFVTKGDANPSTDQSAGHPVVERSSVVGPVVQLNGRPVTVPAVGGLLAWLFGRPRSPLTFGALLLVALAAVATADGPTVRRDVVYASDVLRPLLAGGLLLAVLFVFWGASSHGLTYVATEGAATADHTVPVGESVSRTVSVDTDHLPFTTVVVAATGVTVEDRATTASGTELVVTVPAQPRPGPHHATIAVATYPATLPRELIVRLHGIHWLAATLGTIAPVFAPFLLGHGLLDGRVPLRWTPGRWVRRIGGT